MTEKRNYFIESLKESDQYKFFKASSWFERIILILLNILGIYLPFTLLLLLTGDMYWVWFNIISWLSGITLSYILKLSRYIRTKENLKLSFAPKFGIKLKE